MEKHFDFAILRAIFAKRLRNGSRMAVQKNFKLLKYERIIYHFKVWRFRIHNYFREIFKCRENMGKNRFREISYSIHKIAKTAELKNKMLKLLNQRIKFMDVVRDCGMYEKLGNLYKMKSTVMFRNFIAKEGLI